MSVWEAANPIIKTYSSFPKWPNPFPFIKDIRHLACENTFQAEFTFYGVVAASFIYSNFIPSPAEITRKWLLNQYKCGFYHGPKVRGPASLPWVDPKVGKALVEILNPALRGLFYLWAAQTLWSALDTYQTVVWIEAMCEAGRDETVLAEGEAPITTPGSGSGAAVGYTVFWDPNGRYGPPGSAVIYPEGPLTVNAYGYMQAGGAGINDCRAYLGTQEGELAAVEIGGIPPFGVVPWHLSYSENPVQSNAVYCGFDIDQPAQPVLAASHFIATRFTVTTRPSPPTPPDSGNLNVPPECTAKNMPPFLIPAG